VCQRRQCGGAPVRGSVTCVCARCVVAEGEAGEARPVRLPVVVQRAVSPAALEKRLR